LFTYLPPNPSLLQTPLNFRQIYSVAKAFVVSCPPNLPNILGYADTFPSLEVTLNYPTATFHFETPTGSDFAKKPLFAVFLQGNSALGNGATYAPIDNVTGEVSIPSGLKGYVFALVTTQTNGTVSDENTVAGPAILNFPYDSTGARISP